MARKPLATPVRPLAGRGPEAGFALIGALLVLVLVTALGSAAVFFAQFDLMLAGNNRVQRTAEVAADGALDLVKAMIYGNTAQLNLPLSIPGTDAAALAWRAGTDTNGDGIGDGFTYADSGIDVSVTVRYKQEDTLNFYNPDPGPPTPPAHPVDHVVRYGRDYNFQGAQKLIGRQPVYTATFVDNKTGVKGEADLISTIGFTTPSALFCGGKVHMQKYQWATEESIEVTAGAGTPAVATAAHTNASITIETVRESTTFTGTTTVAAAAAAGATSLTVASTTGFTAPYQLMYGINKYLITCAGRDATHFTGCTGLPAPAVVGTFVNVTSKSTNPSYVAVNPSSTNEYAVNSSYLHQRVYRPAEVQASKVAGLYDQARDSVHVLLGVGDRLAGLDSAFTAAGGGSAGAAAANARFRFYNPSADSASSVYDVPVAFNNSVSPHQCSGIVCYDYAMPAGATPQAQLEAMFGQSFADLRSLADHPAFSCTSTVSLPTGGSSNYGCNLTTIFNEDHTADGILANEVFGTPTKPRVTYFNGTGNTNPVSLVTDAGTQVSGFGILIIDGDADIVGSINWRGLMLIRGDLQFRPWQGGTQALRSGPALATRWNGFLIIGGDLDLWTYWGGSIILGYSSADVAAIKGIISSTVPHKVLSWRRSYN
jgi:hypothetical protein